MARTVRDARLETRAARDRLPSGRKAHWRTLVPGELHLGYRRRRAGTPGVWVARRYAGAGRYKSETLGVADDYQDADDHRFLSYAQAQARAMRAVPEDRRGPLTVADVVADYVAFLHAERRTGPTAEQRAKKLILPTLGRRRVEALTSRELTKWRDDLAASGALVRSSRVGPQRRREPPTDEEGRRARRASTNRIWTILRAALNRAYEHGLVADDSAWRRVKPFREVHARRPGHLSLDECRRLINAAEPSFRPMVQAALLTGCRYGELRELRVRDLAGGTLLLRRSKSGRPRAVVLTEEGQAFFASLAAGRAPDDNMLPRPDGEAWTHAQQVRPMRRACEAARIVPAVGFHQLRHTWASLSIMGGVPLMVVAANMGHADTRMCERHYGHLTETFVTEAIRSSAPRFGIEVDERVVSIARGA